MRLVLIRGACTHLAVYPGPKVADVVGVSAITAWTVLKPWNKFGLAGLIDRRASNSSRSILAACRQAELFTAPQQRPSESSCGVARR
jgi:hypothetical protein